MEKPINKNRILASLFWKFLESSGTQGLHFIIQVILARLLLPEDYGIIALITVFTTFASIFVESGLSTALIQKKETDINDFSTAFYLSLIIACFLYILLFLVSPYIAAFYKIPLISPILRVLSLNLIFGAFNSIQNAIVARNLQFRLLFIRSIGALVLSGALGISLAYAGFGVWALASHLVAYRFFMALILWFTLKWRPKLLFSLERAKTLFSFGWKLLASTLLNTAINDIRNLIIGKRYPATTLGYYTRGLQFPSLIVTNVDVTIQTVMFPVLASQQENRQNTKLIMKRSIMTSAFIIFPLLVGLSVIAKPLVLILLTDKWLPAVPFIQIFCASYALYPIHSANLQVIKGMGYGRTFLHVSIARGIISILILIISIFYGIYAIAIGQIIDGILAMAITAYPNKLLIDYSFGEQMKDIFPSLLLSLIMGLTTYSLSLLNIHYLPLLAIQLTWGALTYIMLSRFFNHDSFSYLMSTLRGFLKRKKRA